MIFVVGHASDPVLARVMYLMRAQGTEFVLLDESASGVSIETATLANGFSGWRIRGGGCSGTRPVAAVLIRRGPVQARPAAARVALSASIDAMLLRTRCPVVNRPSSTTSNYSKPFQVIALGAAGFRVPRTLVTSEEQAALQFVAAHQGQVIFKGVSSVKTVPQTFHDSHLPRLKSLVRCPVQFQERIDGADWRVTVVGTSAFASETRAAALVSIGHAGETLPRLFVDQCIKFTQAQGLLVSGIDARLSSEGEPVVFEMNPFPLITHYEREEDPVISRELCKFLGGCRRARSDILA